MKLLGWFTLSLCISVNTGCVELARRPGDNVSLECSSSQCPRSVDGFTGMYLYHSVLHRQKEVLYFFHSGKVTPRGTYKNRVNNTGNLFNHSITIWSLGTNDSGIYTCVYLKDIKNAVRCNVHVLLIGGPTMSPSLDPELEPQVEGRGCLPLVLAVLSTCAISITATLICVLLIVKVRQWARRRKSVKSAGKDYVYEDMTKFHIASTLRASSLPSSYNETERRDEDIEHFL